MAYAEAPSHAPAGRGGLRPELVMMVPLWLAIAFVLSPELLGGRIMDTMSSDDLMRLVEVRDLLGHQGWYDLVQHRGMPPLGLSIHWTRIVDIPLALVILGLTPLVGQAAAETAALAAWPLALLAVAMVLMLRIADMLAGARTAVPTLVLTALGFGNFVHFRAGAIDHHNLQAVLMLTMVLCIGRIERHWRYPCLAGAAAALSMGVSVEMMPVIIAICAAAALFAIGCGGATAKAVRRFGLAMAGAAILLCPVLVEPATLLRPVCDSFGGPLLLLAAGGGAALAGLATVCGHAGTSVRLRLAVGAALGILLAGAFALAYPACLGAPYATVDPRVETLWLSTVGEALSFPRMLQAYPAHCLTAFGFPLLAIGLALLAWRRSRTGDLGWGVALAATAAQFAVSLWQVRGATPAGLDAVPLMAAALCVLLPAPGSAYSRRALLATVVLSPAAFSAFGSGAAAAVTRLRPDAASAAPPPAACMGARGARPLAALPAGRVLSFVDLGPAILAETPHAIFAAPYHRNGAAIGLMLDAMLGSDAVAERVLREHGVDYVAICPSAVEQRSYAKAAPEGLAARLARGQTPAYLAPVPVGGGTGLMVWRILR